MFEAEFDKKDPDLLIIYFKGTPILNIKAINHNSREIMKAIAPYLEDLDVCMDMSQSGHADVKKLKENYADMFYIIIDAANPMIAGTKHWTQLFNEILSTADVCGEDCEIYENALPSFDDTLGKLVSTWKETF